MLEVVMAVTAPGGKPLVFNGDLGNISNLAALSSYEAWFEGRPATILADYPRWCEPVRGLVARCIAQTELADVTKNAMLPDNWVSARIDIGLNGGGRALRPTRIAMVRVDKEADAEGVERLTVCWSEGRLQACTDVAPRQEYSDVWELASHMLRVSVWGRDRDIPPTRPVIVPAYEGGLYMRTSDLPEPVRSAFEWRQRYSGRPCMNGHWDACWFWDWTDFLNGQR